jgi:EAL domain-containing protein (putative c-di-GMP-specific phosphodiesterase class I)
MAHKLAMNVTAEGIETPAQLSQLRELGCEIGQGYFLSKPLNADAINSLLDVSGTCAQGWPHIQAAGCYASSGLSLAS